MKVMIVSGYFNPLHVGHLDMVEAAASMGDTLVVIVNNDIQQMLKKEKIIINEHDRARLMKALRDVDDVILSIDEDRSVSKTLRMIAEKHSDDELVFANGGTRDTGRAIPETPACRELGITALFEVGGHIKYDSSTRINKATGNEES